MDSGRGRCHPELSPQDRLWLELVPWPIARTHLSAFQDLASLLEQIGCLKYLRLFEEQDVDLRIFLTLTESDLKEIGVT